jgi:hypothetical protein
MVVAALLVALEQPLVFQSDPAPVAEIVRRLAEQENLAITADPNFEREWMVVRSQDMDRNLFLTDLARAAQAEWVRDGNRLILRRTREAKQSVYEVVRESRYPPAWRLTYPRMNDTQLLAVLEGRSPEFANPEAIFPITDLRLVHEITTLVNYDIETIYDDGFVVYRKDVAGFARPYPRAVEQMEDVLEANARRASELAPRVPNHATWIINYRGFPESHSASLIGREVATRGQIGQARAPFAFSRQGEALPDVTEPHGLPADFLVSASASTQEGEPFATYRLLPGWADKLGVRNYTVALDPGHIDMARALNNQPVPDVSRAFFWAVGNRSVYDKQRSRFWSHPIVPFSELTMPDIGRLTAFAKETKADSGLAVVDFMIENELSMGMPWNAVKRKDAHEFHEWQAFLPAYFRNRFEARTNHDYSTKWESLPDYLKRSVLSRYVVGNRQEYFQPGPEPTRVELPNCTVQYWKRTVDILQREANRPGTLYLASPSLYDTSKYLWATVTFHCVTVRRGQGDIWIRTTREGIVLHEKPPLTPEEALPVYVAQLKDRMEAIIDERRKFLELEETHR